MTTTAPGMTVVYADHLDKAREEALPIGERRWLFTAALLDALYDVEAFTRTIWAQAERDFSLIVSATWESYEGIPGEPTPFDLDHSALTVRGVPREVREE